MIRLEEYRDLAGRNRYKAWFDDLDVAAAAKVTVVLERIAEGHTSAMKSVGGGVSEYKVDFGPGYRIYFGKDGDRLVLLLGGGTKKRQSQDILQAQTDWREYKQQKRLALKSETRESKLAQKRK